MVCYYACFFEVTPLNFFLFISLRICLGIPCVVLVLTSGTYKLMALFKYAINIFQTSSTLARFENNKNQLIFAK